MVEHIHHHSKVSPASPLPVYFQKSAASHYAVKYPWYLNLAKTFAIGAIGASLIVYVVDQRERVDELERQLSIQRKNQKDLVKQTQNYKRKVANANMETAKRDVIVQGRMQTHIALLRSQLVAKGEKPVDVEHALERFQNEVKISVTPHGVDLWIPSESELKPSFPDILEYRR